MNLLKKFSQKMQVPDLRINFPQEMIDEMLGYMTETLKTGMLVESKTAKLMADEMVKITKARYCIPVANGGSALEIALAYQRTKRSGRVIVPSNTFAATGLAVERAGFELALAQSDSRHFALNVSDAKKWIENDPHIVGVVWVHIGGIIDPLFPEFVKWCQRKGIWVLEDCAHAIGSTFKKKHAGTWGFAGTFSFFATKTVGAPEGGAIITDDEDFVKFADAEKNYGKVEKWKHDIVQKGWNHRISELSAAVILVQLKHLDEILFARKQIVDQYLELIGDDFDFILPDPDQDSNSWYKLLIATPVAGRVYYEKMAEEGVKLPGTVFDPPLHLMQPFRFYDGGLRKQYFANMENTVKMCENHIALPIYPGLEPVQIEYVCATLIKVSKLVKKNV